MGFSNYSVVEIDQQTVTMSQNTSYVAVSWSRTFDKKPTVTIIQDGTSNSDAHHINLYVKNVTRTGADIYSSADVESSMSIMVRALAVR